LIGGASISLWPELSMREAGAWAYVRAGAGVATSLMLALWLALSPTAASAEERPPRAEASAFGPVGLSPPFEAFGAIGAGLLVGTALSFARRGRR
jgi:uncharacterized protein (DUF58 family)